MHPPPRIRCTITKINDTEFVLFGGTTMTEGFKNKQSRCRWNDVWILKQINTTTFQWLEITNCSGEIPSPRYGHSANLFHTSEGTLLVIFGGNTSSGLVNDVFTLNLDTFIWNRIIPTGEPPLPRYYHSAINTSNDQFLLFAGNSTDREANDSFLLTAEPTWNWSKVHTNDPPSKRYHHSTFKYGQDSYITFGGIQRMSAFQDLNVLHLGDGIWNELKMENVNTYETLSHVKSVMLGNKIVYLNFEQFDKSGQVNILAIDEEIKTATWSTAEIRGDMLKDSPFYIVVPTNNEYTWLIFDLRTKCKVTILNLEMLEMTQTVHLNRATLLRVDRKSDTKCTIHHSGLPSVQTDLKTNFSQLEKRAKLLTNYNHVTLFVTANSHQFSCIQSQDEWSNFLKNKKNFSVFIAECHSESVTKEERLLFLREEVSAMNNVAENVSEDDISKRYKKNIIGAGISSKSINSEVGEMEQPLPMLFSKPNKLSLLRLIHKKLRRFEKWGFSINAEENLEAGIWEQIGIFFKWMFIGIFGIYYLIRKPMSRATSFFLLFIMLFNILTIGMPIIGQLLAGENIFQLPGRFTPLFLYLIFAFTLTAIEKHLRIKNTSNQLTKYNVTIYQKLTSGEYGKRYTTAQDVFFGVTNKESVTKDKWYFKFMAYVFPFIASILHSALMVYYYELENKKTIFTLSTILELSVNFLSTLVYASVLGVCLNVYQRQAKHIEYFSYLMSPQSARAHQLPAIPMNRMKNIIAWMKLRNYIRGHEFLPLVTADAIFRLSLVFLIVLWIIFVLLMVASNGLYAISVFILFHIVLSAFYIISASNIGRTINGWQQRHTVMLYKEMLKIKIEMQQNRHNEEKKEKLKCCVELLENMIEVIESQDPVFALFGFHLEESGAKALTYVLGVGLSLTVIFTARKEIDLELEV